MVRGFWDKLEDPIVALAPMDGVTDAAYRYMVCKHSNPSFTMTEFTNVEGLARGASDMLRAFIYSEIERPVVAQIYGVEVDSYYKTAVMLCYMGFDGIDINMGCPANKVAKRGSGAGLIRTPDLAKRLVKICKKASKDWAEGISLEDAGVHENNIEVIRKIHGEGAERKEIPISVKTRVGFDEVITEEWVKHLLEVEPANISMHGRTLKQMYMGEAAWEEIAKGAELCKKTETSYLGNGDIQSMDDALEKIKKYGVDGVLIGRATFGNPWFFSDKEVTDLEKFEAAIEHAHYLEKEVPEVNFISMRKHLGWYCKGFDGARELRKALMRVQTADDVEATIRKFQSGELTVEN